MKHKLFKTHLLASSSKLPSVDSCLTAKNDFKALVLQSSNSCSDILLRSADIADVAWLLKSRFECENYENLRETNEFLYKNK